jgi:hydroxymethylpyrimidine/phosphomethylpyrimidine kinase
MTVPIALSIAGSDPSGGAGIQADLKTFSALGVYGATVITTLTAQNTQEVAAIELVSPQFVAAQLDAVCGDLAVRAVKIGMLGSAAVIEAVADGLDRHALENVVLDPVMVASTGRELLARGALDVLRRVLLPRASIVTPNLPEAAALLEEPLAQDEAAMRAQAAQLLRRGARAVLIKGGHAAGAESADFFADGRVELRLPAPRIGTKNTHGTGCTLSAAIAAGLAKGFPLAEAVAQAKAFVAAALAAADRLAVGRGAGPLHHFHEWW